MGNDRRTVKTPQPDNHAGWSSIRFETRPWQRTILSMASRRQIRASIGPYEAAIPAFIAKQSITLPPDVLAHTEDASHALTRFDAETGNIAIPFAPILLRTESSSSSEVENLTASAKQLALAQIDESTPSNAKLILANVRATQAAISLAEDLSTDAMLALHAALLERSNPEMAGNWRDEQVWIGGGGISPHLTRFVPPHHERVPELMNDVMEFSQRTDLPVLAQTAIHHAQFETIHPFPDGNGRTGRALNQSLLRAGGITHNVTVPVSAGLLQDTEVYFDALTRYREGDVTPIVMVITEASFSAAGNGRQLIGDIQAARARWDEVVRARTDSSAHKLKDFLLRQPVVNTKITARELDVSEVAAQTPINRLVEAGVLKHSGGGVRYRRWQANEILAALDAFGARAK